MKMVPQEELRRQRDKVLKAIRYEIARLEDGLASYQHVRHLDFGHIGDLHKVLADLETINGEEE